MVSDGVLYIVSTPIGNLDDMTFRGLSVLKSSDIILCEDTRHSGRLLKHFDISARLLSYHDHNALSRIPLVVEKLAGGCIVSLITDAGTPGVSDPAYRVIRAAIDEHIPVVPVPGASAVLSALVVSGLPLDRFVFEGFLPVKSGQRRNRLEFLSSEPRTIVLYISPYKIIKTLTEIFDILGDREISLSRELTKLHEETIRGTVSSVLDTLSGRTVKGECTLVIKGC